MADTENMASTATPASRGPATKRATANPETRAAASSRRREEDLEAQIERLQDDLRSIADTVSRIAERKVGEVQGRAESEVRNIVRSGQQAVEEIQDEFGDVERQLKQSIRRKPLTAVAGALALGFVLAVITR